MQHLNVWPRKVTLAKGQELVINYIELSEIYIWVLTIVKNAKNQNILDLSISVKDYKINR